MKPILSVREIEPSDIKLITDYWINANEEFLKSMGADINKIPAKEEWNQMLLEQLDQPYHEKKSYCTIWMNNGEPVGHCNVNKIIFGEEAYMHLHLWNDVNRQKGTGVEFVKMSIPWFFINLDLKILYCEPYASNPAPNITLQKIGFTFVKEYRTIPGYLNFEQPVKLWKLDREQVPHY